MVFSKNFVIVLFVGLMMISSATAANWYVDNTVAASGNGESWNSAWKYFSNINWNSVQPGDTIYISGGTTSKKYTQLLTISKSGTTGNPITFTKGIEEGHNGDVIIDRDFAGEGITMTDKHDIIIKNFVIMNTLGAGIYVRGTTSNGVHDVYIDSNKISEFRGQGGIFVSGYGNGGNARDNVDNIYIRNNTITTLTYGNYQTDAIYVQYQKSAYILGNTIHLRNTYNPSQHCDGIQSSDGVDLVVAGNYIDMFNDNGEANQPDQGIIVGRMTGNVIVYNNIVYSPYLDGYSNTVLLGMATTGNWYVYGNTLISYTNSNLLKLSEPNNVYVKNNIFYSQRGSSAITISTGTSANRIDNNLYYYTTGNSVVTNWGSLSQMQSAGAETHGIVVDPQFMNYPGNFMLQSNSQAIDAGANLGAPYNVDIDGVSRPQGGGWDIGAYEFGGSVPSCSEINGEYCSQGQLCEGGYFTSSLEGGLCCVGGGVCSDPVVCSDVDSDGYGNPASSMCSYSGLDCDDSNPNVNPGASEICGNGLDDDCNGQVDEGCPVGNDPDLNGDGCIDLNEISAFVGLWLNNEVTLQEVSDAVSLWLEGTGCNVGQLEKLTIVDAVDDGVNHEIENPIGHSFDGDLLTRWSANPIPLNIDFDLGGVQEVHETRFSFYNWDNGRVYGYSVSVSLDGVSWVEVVPLRDSLTEEWTVDSFSPVDARYVRVSTETNSQSYWAGLWEAEIWGVELNPPPECVDNDGDLHGEYCVAGADCNDGDSSVWDLIFCDYDGSSCGSYDLCLSSCPVPPVEICGNGIDEDCDGEDLVCPAVCGNNDCESGETCSSCEGDCGPCPSGDGYYVSTSGSSSGDGSFENPWDIQTGLSSINAGETLYIMPGTYEGAFSISKDGTSEINRITIQAYDSNDKPTLLGLSSSVTQVLSIGGNYVTVKDIKVRGTASGRRVIRVQGDYVTLDGVESYYEASGSSSANHNINVYSAKNFVFRNGLLDRSPRNGLYLVSSNVEPGGADNCLIENNEFRDITTHHAINIFPSTTHIPPEPISGCIIRNNYIHDLGGQYAFYLRHFENFQIYNNLVINGNGLSISSSTHSGFTYEANGLFANNLVVADGNFAVVDWTANDLEIKNNIFYGVFYTNQWNNGMILRFDPNSGVPGYTGPPIYNHDFNNNVYFPTNGNMYMRWNNQIVGTNNVGGTNLDPQSTLEDWQQTTGLDMNSLAVDPLIIDMNTGETASNSPVKDVGVDLSQYFTTDYNGVERTGLWDIGPYNK